MWRFSLLGSFKHEMFYSKFLFWEQKGREFHLCLVYFTQNEKEKKNKKKFDKVADSRDHEEDNSNFSNSHSVSLKFSSAYISLL